MNVSTGRVESQTALPKRSVNQRARSNFTAVIFKTSASWVFYDSKEDG